MGQPKLLLIAPNQLVAEELAASLRNEGFAVDVRAADRGAYFGSGLATEIYLADGSALGDPEQLAKIEAIVGPVDTVAAYEPEEAFAAEEEVVPEPKGRRLRGCLRIAILGLVCFGALVLACGRQRTPPFEFMAAATEIPLSKEDKVYASEYDHLAARYKVSRPFDSVSKTLIEWSKSNKFEYDVGQNMAHFWRYTSNFTNHNGRTVVTGTYEQFFLYRYMAWDEHGRLYESDQNSCGLFHSYTPSSFERVGSWIGL